MPSPWPATPPTAAHRAAYADAVPRSFWLDSLPERSPHPPLEEALEADLCIVGGGYTGLWAALYAKSLDPARDVVLLEATRCGNGASGRNGGFALASLTHGTRNGLSRFPNEIDRLERLGRENFDGLARDLHDLSIDGEFEPPVISSSHSSHTSCPIWPMKPSFAPLRPPGGATRYRANARAGRLAALPRSAVDRTGSALVHPGKLADGLRAAAVRAGVRIHEHTPVRALHDGVTVIADGGTVKARGVVLATSAYPPLLRAIGRYVAPIYDYALVTEPIDLSLLGWRHRQGVGDMANQFHYYRLTADDRILWGGYDAVYRYGGPVGPHLDDHEPTFAMLSQHFFTTFPQLEGVRFSHRWGGAIDTCSRFSVFFGRALGGRVVYALGYTGLGVAATRFGGRVALDLLDGRQTEATELAMVRRRPLPFPPEPLRSAVIQLTRNRLAAADRDEGRRGVWLRTLDRLGLGFDS